MEWSEYDLHNHFAADIHYSHKLCSGENVLFVSSMFVMIRVESWGRFTHSPTATSTPSRSFSNETSTCSATCANLKREQCPNVS